MILESTYLIGAGLIGFGAILGIFFRLKTIGLAGVVLFILAIAGIAVMGIPFAWGLLMLGAAAVRTIFKRDNP